MSQDVRSWETFQLPEAVGVKKGEGKIVLLRNKCLRGEPGELKSKVPGWGGICPCNDNFPPVWVGECPEVSLQQEQIYPKVCHTALWYDLPLSTNRKCGLSIALEG